MALAVIMLRKDLGIKQTELTNLRKVSEGFTAREKELEIAIGEANTEEERSAVKESIEAFENERKQNTEAVERVEGEITDIEKRINELEVGQGQKRTKPTTGEQERTVISMENAEIRTRFFGMTINQRDAFFARDEIKEFSKRLREYKGQNRGVTGAELGIPTVALELLRSNIDKYSKLIKYIKLKQLKGKARQSVAGMVPEAIWTEAVASLNELDISFTQVEVDGYKVGGYIAVPNAYLEDDDDVDLLQYVLEAMGQAIGVAVDKGIVYGTGTKMPVGFITRLAATTQPPYWGSNQGEFKNLSASNIKKLALSNLNGVSFFQPFILALGIADPEYSLSGKAVWLCNRKTHIDILSRALAFDSAATLVAGMKDTMPVVGGDIVELSFMKDYEVAGGFLDVYLLAERSGANIRSSDIPMMLQDQTLVTATQRFDGKPLMGEAFVLVSYDNTAPETSEEFPEDYANDEIGALGVTCAASAATAGNTAVTVTGATAGAVLKYKIAGKPLQIVNGKKIGTDWTAFDSGDEIACAAGKYINVVEVDTDSKAVAVGSAVSVPKA